MRQFSRTMRQARMLLCVSMAAVLLAGCVTPQPSLYRWGEYEDIIYAGYKNPGSSNPVTDGELLAADMARTEAEGKQIPPGVRIHLGYLYFEQGRIEEARALFEMEKQIFPESTVFVDGMLARTGARQ